jgi:hypothetical protein
VTKRKARIRLTAGKFSVLKQAKLKSTTTVADKAKAPVATKLKARIKLKARKLSVLSQVKLRWIGARSSTVTVYESRKLSKARRSRQALVEKRSTRVVVRRVAAANTGSYTARLSRRARGVYYFKVCEAKRARCSARVRVLF